MNNVIHSRTPQPKFPAPLAWPLGLIPTRLNSAILVKLLNRLFAPELADGELDFLAGRQMLIKVADARLSYRITLEDGLLASADNGQREDLSIEGNIYDFLLLATRREDTDTLFFNRRLKLGGDTELGLYVKNFLDGMEIEGRMGPLLKLLNGAALVMARLP
ncbi:MAG: SCP2 sterol-binding domain-containing protein [Chromatiaceae bacterium]|nr:SCP2 sterol-binding domain-containing protein [Chromatiaceae bacterium]MCP5443474.1 SCP2 sterol-binding domain-containing protein [Chromatiaceae bacterium]